MNRSRQTFLTIAVFGMIQHASCAQQTINSRGNNNTNVNGVLIQPTVSISETRVIKRTVVKTFGTENEWEGVLVPGKSDVADGPCDTPVAKEMLRDDVGQGPRTQLRVFAGSNEMLCHQLPCNLVRTDAEEILWVGGKPGLLKVETRIKDHEGNIIVSIEHGKFYVNRNRTYRPPARDRSSLEVFDEKGAVILDLSFVNPKTLLIKEGQFFDKLGNHLAITSNSLDMSQSTSAGRGQLQTTCLSSFQGVTMRAGTFTFGGVVDK